MLLQEMVKNACLSDKQIKKQNEQDVKDLKATINFLCKFNGYDKDIAPVICGLIIRLFQLQGPLK